jgi:hypothetical protein
MDGQSFTVEHWGAPPVPDDPVLELDELVPELLPELAVEPPPPPASTMALPPQAQATRSKVDQASPRLRRGKVMVVKPPG